MIQEKNDNVLIGHINDLQDQIDTLSGLVGDGALQTSAQTLISGINELNSKFLPLTGGIITGGVEIQGNLIAHGHKLAFRHLDAGLD